MDFKALMAAQIAKAKPSSPATSATTSSNSKYQRRSDAEAQRQAEYVAEQARLEKEREERAAKKRKLEDEEVEKVAAREAKMRKLAQESKARREAEEKEEERWRRKRLGLPELPDAEDRKEDSPLVEGQPDIPDDLLQSKLREINEPAKLFDEEYTARLKRYYKLTSKSLAKPKYSKGPIPTTLEPVTEKDMLLPTKVSAPGTQDYKLLHRQLASYFTLLLSEWNIALSAREMAVKESQTGRAALATYQSVVRDLTPMFRKLESQSLSSDVLNPLVEITRNIQARRYVDANDGYLRLSIGKAAWPIGVTMVGIHERSARERIHGGGEDKAHIMSDEVTRKMLQSVKRCVSFAQTRWPPDDIGQLMG